MSAEVPSASIPFYECLLNALVHLPQRELKWPGFVDMALNAKSWLNCGCHNYMNKSKLKEFWVENELATPLYFLCPIKEMSLSWDTISGVGRPI